MDAIISVLSGDTTEWQRKTNVRSDDPSAAFHGLFPGLLLVLMIFVVWYLISHANGPPSGRGGRGGRAIFVPYGGYGGFGGGGFSGGGGFGGGFGGGGGSSGGGGASGSW